MGTEYQVISTCWALSNLSLLFVFNTLCLCFSSLEPSNFLIRHCHWSHYLSACLLRTKGRSNLVSQAMPSFLEQFEVTNTVGRFLSFIGRLSFLKPIASKFDFQERKDTNVNFFSLPQVLVPTLKGRRSSLQTLNEAIGPIEGSLILQLGDFNSIRPSTYPQQSVILILTCFEIEESNHLIRCNSNHHLVISR
jgi:hypothetical protein